MIEIAVNIYTAVDSYLIYKEETAWGTSQAPSAGAFVDRVTSFNVAVKNNRQRHSNLGACDAVVATNGAVEISGNITAQLTNPTFFQYLICGVQVDNGGTQANPSDVNEVNNIGYASANCPTLSLEMGTAGADESDVLLIDGCTFTDWTLTAKTGEVVTWNANYRARNITRGTTAETYVGPTEEPFTFADGTLTVGSDTVVKVDSFELSGSNNTNYQHALGSRLISQPTNGSRRYDFTINVLHSYDSTASKLSGVEIREKLFGAAGVTTPETGGTPTEFGDIVLTLTEGAVSGDESIIISLESCYLDEISEPVEAGDTGGPIMFTITGFALAALTNGAENTLIEFGTKA